MTMGEISETVIDRLARIEEKLDRMREDDTKSEARYDALESRMSRAERLLWIALGIAAASGGASVTKIIDAMMGVS